MSNWSHVAAIFRIDSMRFNPIDFTDVFGREFDFYDFLESQEDIEKSPDKFLPFGSEGSLQMSVWENPNRSCIAAYTVSIFGDLRDHESIEEILKWFDEKCKLVNIRQAVITVHNEYHGVHTKTYER